MVWDGITSLEHALQSGRCLTGKLFVLQQNDSKHLARICKKTLVEEKEF